MPPPRLFVELHDEGACVVRRLVQLQEASVALPVPEIALRIAEEGGIRGEVTDIAVEGYAVSPGSHGGIFRDGDRVTIRVRKTLALPRRDPEPRHAPSPAELPKVANEGPKANVSTLEALRVLKEASNKSPRDRKKSKKRGREVVLAQVDSFFQEWPDAAPSDIRSGDIVICRPPAQADMAHFTDVERYEHTNDEVKDPANASDVMLSSSLRLAVVVHVDPQTGATPLVTPTIAQRQNALKVVSKWQTLQGMRMGVPSLPVSLEHPISMANINETQSLKIVSRLPQQVPVASREGNSNVLDMLRAKRAALASTSL